MANIGRGAYEPPGDDVHIFDGSEDDDDVEGSRLPLLIVIALFVLAAFAGVVWLAYTQGVARGHSDAPRVIVAQKGPAKVAANGEGNATPYKGLKIYEQPAPTDVGADHPAARLSPSAQPETTLVTPRDTPLPAAETANREPPLSVAKSITPPVVKPAATPPVQKAAIQPAPQAEASAAPAPLVAKAPPAASSGSYVLQIGAYKSQAEADAAWKTYQSRHAGTLSGYSPDVKMVDLGEKGTWYRLRVSSFADKVSAQAVCAKLTAEGGACFPAK